jgi:anaerobic magnesium-protoporphyrin IX monomethyl ester cyclase
MPRQNKSERGDTDVVLIGISHYGDPFAEDWHPDLRYTAAFLRREGLAVELVLPSSFAGENAMASHIRRVNPRVIFLNLNEENTDRAVLMIRRLGKTPLRAKIVLGGTATSSLAGTLIDRCRFVDFIIKGEWELTLLEMTRKIKAGSGLDDTPGLTSRDFDNPFRPLIENLDVLDRMTTDGLGDLLRDKARAERVGHIMTSRGCYGHCSFCSVPSFYRASRGRFWRGKSPMVVVDEIEDLASTFGIRYFLIQDDNFVGPGKTGRERVKAIAREINRRRLKIKYFACCRLNDLEPAMLILMKASGLDRLAVSVESTSQRALELFKKGFDAKKIYPALSLLETMKIKTEINLIFFDPYMTIGEVRENLKLLTFLRNSTYIGYSNSFAFNELKPFPWTPIVNTLRQDGLLDPRNDSCRYRDPSVRALVDLVRHFREHPSLQFKHQLLFTDLDAVSLLKNDRDLYGRLNSFCSACRDWLNTRLLPALVEEACDVLERNPDDASSLSLLRARFDREMEKIKALGDTLRRELKDYTPSS